MMSFRHHLMKGPEEQIPAMNRIKDIFHSSNFSGKVFPIAVGYASWETDEVWSSRIQRTIVKIVKKQNNIQSSTSP